MPWRPVPVAGQQDVAVACFGAWAEDEIAVITAILKADGKAVALGAEQKDAGRTSPEGNLVASAAVYDLDFSLDNF